MTSGLASTAPRISGANASIRADRLSPPTRSGRMSPVFRTRDVQRIALEMLTPKRAAACRRDRPPSTAATTRLRRSTDKAVVMAASLLTSSHLVPTRAALGIPARLCRLGKRSRAQLACDRGAGALAARAARHRPLVLSRKNSLFARSEGGGEH